ncbi:hypothetical protein ACQEVB_28270 [Pseudonocardia sp. CA-107938]|uniref:hypothetical protein n=1 Tax=Pseudonocardia sp. CA-107938 TaxID=3240021 RepID=UPI003D8C523C
MAVSVAGRAVVGADAPPCAARRAVDVLVDRPFAGRVGRSAAGLVARGRAVGIGRSVPAPRAVVVRARVPVGAAVARWVVGRAGPAWPVVAAARRFGVAAARATLGVDRTRTPARLLGVGVVGPGPSARGTLLVPVGPGVARGPVGPGCPVRIGPAHAAILSSAVAA